jgi:hypothetical protein
VTKHSDGRRQVQWKGFVSEMRKPRFSAAVEAHVTGHLRGLISLSENRGFKANLLD